MKNSLLMPCLIVSVVPMSRSANDEQDRIDVKQVNIRATMNNLLRSLSVICR